MEETRGGDISVEDAKNGDQDACEKLAGKVVIENTRKNLNIFSFELLKITKYLKPRTII